MASAVAVTKQEGAETTSTRSPPQKRKSGTFMRRVTSGSMDTERKELAKKEAKELKEAKAKRQTLRKEKAETEKLGQVFQKLEVETIDGDKVKVPSLWNKGPVVIYFIRRFGCIVCRHNATILSRCKAALDAKGVRFVAVAPERDGMEDFVAGNYFAGEVFADPNRACYKALKLKRASLLGILSKRVRQVIERASNSGIKGNMKGDFKQLGGLFVISSDGSKGHCRVLLEFRDAFFGDAVDASFMLKTLNIKEGDTGFYEATERRMEDYEDTNTPDSAMADNNECVVCLRSAIMEQEEAQETVAEKGEREVDELIKLEEEKIQTALLSRAMAPVSLLDINEVLNQTADMAPPPVPRRLSKMISQEIPIIPDDFEIPADLPPSSSFVGSPTTQVRGPKPPQRLPRGVVGCGDDMCG